MKFLSKIPTWIKLQAWHKNRRENYYRECHRRGSSCPVCGIQIDSCGRIHRSVRDMIFYCQYDIPERAGKNRFRYDLIEGLDESLRI